MRLALVGSCLDPPHGGQQADQDAGSAKLPGRQQFLVLGDASEALEAVEPRA